MLVDALKDEGARLTALHLAARHGYQADGLIIKYLKIVSIKYRQILILIYHIF